MTNKTYNNDNRKRTNDNTFYYFTTHDFAISNLKNSRIKISDYTTVNDIHELSSINFTENDTEALSAIEHYKRNVGFISFSKYWDSPLMWGHYSENNRGVCLGFEITLPMSDTTYRSEKIHVSELEGYTPTSKKTSIDIIRNIVNTKSSDWIYEQESRLFENFDIKDLETGLFFREIDKDLNLKEIIIGPNSKFSPKDFKNYLCKIQFEGSLKIFKTKPSSDFYLMDIDYNFNEEFYEYKKPTLLAIG